MVPSVWKTSIRFRHRPYRNRSFILRFFRDIPDIFAITLFISRVECRRRTFITVDPVPSDGTSEEYTKYCKRGLVIIKLRIDLISAVLTATAHCCTPPFKRKLNYSEIPRPCHISFRSCSFLRNTLRQFFLQYLPGKSIYKRNGTVASFIYNDSTAWKCHGNILRTKLKISFFFLVYFYSRHNVTSDFIYFFHVTFSCIFLQIAISRNGIHIFVEHQEIQGDSPSTSPILL